MAIRARKEGRSTQRLQGQSEARRRDLTVYQTQPKAREGRALD